MADNNFKAILSEMPVIQLKFHMYFSMCAKKKEKDNTLQNHYTE